MYTTQYQSYLMSDNWQRKRRERLEIDGHKCVMCGSRSRLQVHHVNYRHLGYEDPMSDLCTVCKSCHKKLHNFYSRKR